MIKIFRYIRVHTFFSVPLTSLNKSNRHLWRNKFGGITPWASKVKHQSVVKYLFLFHPQRRQRRLMYYSFQTFRTAAGLSFRHQRLPVCLCFFRRFFISLLAFLLRAAHPSINFVPIPLFAVASILFRFFWPAIREGGWLSCFSIRKRTSTWLGSLHQVPFMLLLIFNYFYWLKL